MVIFIIPAGICDLTTENTYEIVQEDWKLRALSLRTRSSLFKEKENLKKELSRGLTKLICTG